MGECRNGRMVEERCDASVFITLVSCLCNQNKKKSVQPPSRPVVNTSQNGFVLSSAKISSDNLMNKIVT